MPAVTLVAVALGLVAIVTLILLGRARREATAEKAEAERLRARFRGVVDADAERDRVLGAAREAAAEAERLRVDATSWDQQVRTLRAEFDRLDEDANLQSFGFYKPHYDMATSEAYEHRLEHVREKQKVLLKEKRAAVGLVEWQVNGSKREGQKQINQTLKLMLRAFNGECDAAIAKVKYNNVHVMENRIRKAYEVVNSLAEVQKCEISEEYLGWKLEELFLVHECQEKVYAEKEEQRRIREQMREEELAQRELERARLDAEKEERRYEDALAKARLDVELAAGARQAKLQAQIAELEQRLAEAHMRKERAIAQAQLTRSGHVYVISNVGSFGEEVFKIGMTRRLDPMERIKELGDASVPFEFDVHAVIYTEDAPGLENALHRRFQWRRINRVNERKEFFRVGIDEIADAVRAERGEITIVKDAEAVEYRKTLALVADEVRNGVPVVDPLPRSGARYDRRSAARLAAEAPVAAPPVA
jgi:hypothetical protein